MVYYQKKESIAIITLDREGLKNAIKTHIITRLDDIRNEISVDRNIKVIIVTGKENFCIGNDRDKRSLFENKIELIRSLSIASIIEQLDQPIIAATNGDIFGQGLELALACDLRICTETAHFAMNQITYGDIPWDGGTQRLSRVVGRAKAMEMILTGEIIDAREAHRIGLVHRVVPDDELLAVAMDMARGIASNGPIAVRYAKEAIYKGMDLSLEQGLRLEADLYFLLHTSRDRTEGIRAFQEKRKAQFEGK